MSAVIYGIKRSQRWKMHNYGTAPSIKASQHLLLTKCPLGGLSNREMVMLRSFFKQRCWIRLKMSKLWLLSYGIIKIRFEICFYVHRCSRKFCKQFGLCFPLTWPWIMIMNSKRGSEGRQKNSSQKHEDDGSCVSLMDATKWNLCWLNFLIERLSLARTYTHILQMGERVPTLFLARCSRGKKKGRPRCHFLSRAGRPGPNTLALSAHYWLFT